jgi:3-methyl-2-oxobutanoate hydroxymethyltransferase
MSRVTTVTLRQRKEAGEKIAVLTAYDYPTARLMDQAGVEVILVGDSCAQVVMGYPDTLHITMDDMIRHTAMVSRGVTKALIVGDMPFLSYQVSPEDALRNAARFITEGGAQAVKLEGPVSRFGAAIELIVNAGIPVMGHLGLTPQSVHQLGGYPLQGNDPESRAQLLKDAKFLQAAGCFSLVLEKIPADLGKEISEALTIPTIGIAAGPHCDGQVLVVHDMLGLGIKARHAKVYVDVGAAMGKAFGEYVEDVKAGRFPSSEQSY